jgi:hypothetical protein|eukprot:COSAG01_NODE_4102_length_5348_cov_5.912555_7_plen_161_part_00
MVVASDPEDTPGRVTAGLLGRGVRRHAVCGQAQRSAAAAGHPAPVRQQQLPHPRIRGRAGRPGPRAPAARAAGVQSPVDDRGGAATTAAPPVHRELRFTGLVAALDIFDLHGARHELSPSVDGHFHPRGEGEEDQGRDAHDGAPQEREPGVSILESVHTD